MSKIYKSVFTAFVHSVSLALKFPCVVSVTWRRGQKISEVKEKKQIDKGVVTFEESLQLECNMNCDLATKKFQEKKTRFTVLIFSEKGNKQAGQVNLDVSELLNAKQKQMKFQKPLEKCPDKNAKLIFTLSAYIKQEVQPDAVSMRSENSIAPESHGLNTSSIQLPDFKKKKQQNINPISPQVPKDDKAVNKEKMSPQQRVPLVNKVDKERLKLQQENKKLKAQLEQLREIQIQNTTLKRRYQEAEKKSFSYYTKKLEETKKEFAQAKQKAKTVEVLLVKKEELQKQMCNCKQQMGRILNFAMISNNQEMAEEISSIYQGKRP